MPESIDTPFNPTDTAFEIVDAPEIMDEHETIDPLETMHTSLETMDTPLETDWLRVEVPVRPLGTEWVRVELPDNPLENLLVFEARDVKLDTVAKAVEPPIPPIKTLTLEEVLAGVILLAPTPLALDSQEVIALANPAAAILGDKEIVSREVFNQAIRNATIKFTYPRVLAIRHPRYLEQFAKVRKLSLKIDEIDRLGFGDEIQTALFPLPNLEYLVLECYICGKDHSCSKSNIEEAIKAWRHHDFGNRLSIGVKYTGFVESASPNVPIQSGDDLPDCDSGEET